MVARKGTLLIPSGPSHNPELRHLHIVCTDPDTNGRVVLVSVTTLSNNLCDQTCVLQPYDHEWLRHPSYVLYRKARFEHAKDLDEGIRSGSLEVRSDINSAAFLRVFKGLCRSTATPRFIKRHLGC